MKEQHTITLPTPQTTDMLATLVLRARRWSGKRRNNTERRLKCPICLSANFVKAIANIEACLVSKWLEDNEVVFHNSQLLQWQCVNTEARGQIGWKSSYDCTRRLVFHNYS